MSEKRRDSKNRILRTGESQEADGRYKFRYIDGNGKRKTVYSWRLVATDSIPARKRDNAPLREQEKAINRDLNDMITPDGAGLTVLDLVKKYIATKTGVKHTTRAGYGTVINLLDKDPFGARRIDKIRLSDANEWLIRLQQVDKKRYSAIHSIRGVVRPAFQMAVDDDILRNNPFEFQLVTVVVNDAVTREAITRKQERTFLDFIKNDTHYSKYYDGMYILFKTGMRISEFTGLTVKDLDMENRTINIDHQLQKTGTLVYIDTTKTYGKVITVGKIREYFAELSSADFTEPITAGIFVSIVAWASYQRSEDETPYWRTLKANGELNAKYPNGIEAQKEKLEAEGHTIIQKGRKNVRYYVKDYENSLFDLK